MTLRPMLLALLVAAVAFAGCAENDGGGQTPTTTAPTGGTPAGGTTPTGATPAATTPGAGGADPTPTISTLTVGTEAAYPPFEDIVGGQIVGFDIEVMREIANRSGFTVTFQNADFTTIIPSVQNGQFGAGVSAFTITEERKQQVDFTVPYYQNTLMAAVQSATTGIDAPEDLQGKKVCTQEGTTSEFYLRETLKFADADLMLLDSAPLCAEALKRGDVQALMIDAAFVRSLIQANDGQLKQAFVIEDVDEEFGIAIKKGNTELLVAMNTALNAMKQDGTLRQLVDKWQV